MKKILYEVKTIEEAHQLAVQDLRVSLEDIKFTVVNEKKGFLGIGGKLSVEAEIAVDGIQKGKEYIQNILNANEVSGTIEVIIEDEMVEFAIDTEDFNGYLIGKNAKNLIALQTLVSIVVNNYYDNDNYKMVTVDVGEYKKRRKRQLEMLAIQVGKQVAKTKQVVKLDSLNAYERKIVHSKLSTWVDVKTHSEGQEPNRYLVVEPK